MGVVSPEAVARDKERNRLYMQAYRTDPAKTNILEAQRAYRKTPEFKAQRKLTRGKRKTLSTEDYHKRSRSAHLKHLYGLTLEDYDNLLEAQKGGCAICGKLAITEPHSKLKIDHDHNTGEVRGLLCSTCNIGLGAFRDTPEHLELAALYLREHNLG